MDWFEFTYLPQLQSVRFSSYAFNRLHSVVFESDWMDGLMIQICLNYNPFDLVVGLFVVILVMIEKRLAMNPTTTGTHLQCEVRLNELMNEQIFLHWWNSKEITTTSMLSVQWFWRVLIWCLIEVAIPRLSSYEIYFGSNCFYFPYSLQSSSTHPLISSSFDATALQSAIRSICHYL